MKIIIQQLNEQEEWSNFKTIKGDDAWDKAVKEVFDLNSSGENKYRAIWRNGFLAHIYCSTFYTIPT